jgi:hypothetical protein
MLELGYAGALACRYELSGKHVTSPQHHVPFRMKSFHRTAV